MFIIFQKGSGLSASDKILAISTKGMRQAYWDSECHLPRRVLDTLAKAGIARSARESDETDLWIYDTPDEIIRSAILLQDYSKQTGSIVDQLLNTDTNKNTLVICSRWRIERLSADLLREWMHNTVLPSEQYIDSNIFLDPATPPEPDSFAARIAIDIIEKNPEVLTRYLDLEMKGETHNSLPDTDYLKRISQYVSPSRLFNRWMVDAHKIEQQTREKEELYEECRQIRKELAARQEHMDKMRLDIERYYNLANARAGIIQEYEELIQSSLRLLEP